MNLLRNDVYKLFINTHVWIKIYRELHHNIIYIANERRHVRIQHHQLIFNIGMFYAYNPPPSPPQTLNKKKRIKNNEKKIKINWTDHCYYHYFYPWRFVSVFLNLPMKMLYGRILGLIFLPPWHLGYNRPRFDVGLVVNWWEMTDQALAVD